MKLVLGMICVLLPATAWGQASAGDTVVRTSVDPHQGIVIGQPVRLNVEVLFPGEMLHPPRVSIPEAPGAQILRFETQATTMRDRIGDRDYVGQSFEFVLFPRRGGEIAIPAAHVALLDRSGEATGSAKGEPVRIAVTVPPGIDPSGPVLAAEHVRVEQSWSPEPQTAQFKPGGALVRRIERQADGVPALGMAEFGFAAPEGVRVYADAPVVEDRSNRGIVEGHRTDKVTYVFEKPGTYDLPALVQPWWNLTDKQARTETLAGTTVTVAAVSPAARARMPDTGWIGRSMTVTGLLGASLLGGLALLRLLHRYRERYRASPAFGRSALMRVARQGDPRATYRAMRLWRGTLSASEAESLDSDPRLKHLQQQLAVAIFARGSDWGPPQGRDLAAAVSAWSPEIDTKPKAGFLPPLNPQDRVHPANREA